MTRRPDTTMKSSRQPLLLAGVILTAGLLAACGGDSPSSPPRTSPFEGRWTGTYTGDPFTGPDTGTVRLDMSCDAGCAALVGTCSLETPRCRVTGTFQVPADGGAATRISFLCEPIGTDRGSFQGPLNVEGSQITGRIIGTRNDAACPGIQGTISLRRQ